jgi:predicted aspartyl protease
MGFTNVRVEEDLSRKGVRCSVDLFVDTGALYSIVPGAFLRELGVEPTQRLEFELADGRTFLREVGEARFHCDGRERRFECHLRRGRRRSGSGRRHARAVGP